jgi:hypothetical protein
MTSIRYRIEALSDFRRVPLGKLSACLTDFASWVVLTKAGIELGLKPLGPAGNLDGDLFVWVDDGRHDAKVALFVKGADGADDKDNGTPTRGPADGSVAPGAVDVPGGGPEHESREQRLGEFFNPFSRGS